MRTHTTSHPDTPAAPTAPLGSIVGHSGCTAVRHLRAGQPDHQATPAQTVAPAKPRTNPDPPAATNPTADDVRDAVAMFKTLGWIIAAGCAGAFSAGLFGSPWLAMVTSGAMFVGLVGVLVKWG